MSQENPELIQEPPPLREGVPPPIPLFLIHDGGGTTFAYHCLDPLSRPVYGLFNPRYHSGGSFEGGVRGMGRLYAGMIRATCDSPSFPTKRGPDGRSEILLGGWSMGGLLSFEMARTLAGDPQIRVVGVVMVESMCPIGVPIGTGREEAGRRSGGGPKYLETLEHFRLEEANRNLALSVRAMREALRVVRDWEPPEWEGRGGPRRPRFSLIRARDPLRTRGKGTHVLDIHRGDPRLGWDRYDPGLLTETLDVRGNHFEMFAFRHIPGVSEAIKRCCDTLEKLGRD